MRCLHCGKELARLKRWTGGGDFCSDAHKQSYQDEYNRLALSRLLQAQAKSGDAKLEQNAPPARATTATAAPVAVEEPIEVEEPVEEVLEEAAVEPIEEVEVAPPEYVQFFVEKPLFALLADGPHYLEPWMDGGAASPAPAAPQWSVEDQLFSLPTAELMPLKMHPGVDRQAQPMAESAVNPNEFTNTKLEPNVPFAVTSSHDLPAAGPIVLKVAPLPAGNTQNAILGVLDFPTDIARSSALLDRFPAGIDFPAEDSDVNVEASGPEAAVSAPASDITVPAIPEESSPESEGTPRAALEALSKLHQDLVEHEQVAAPETSPAPVDSQPIPREADELLTIPLKSFAPSKPILLVDADALLTLTQPQLPRLKALPLRPKVALAPPGFMLPSKEAPARSPLTEAKFKAAAIVPQPRTDVRPKPAVAAKQSVQPQQPAKPVQQSQPAKPLQPEPVTKPAPPPQLAKPAAKPAPPPPAAAKPTPPPPAAKPTPPVQAAKPVQTKPPAAAAQVPVPLKEPTQSAPVSQPAARTAKPPATTEPLRTPPPRKEETPAKPPSKPIEPTLTFETLELQLMANTAAEPFWASLKGKLAIAIALVLALGLSYFLFGGKSHKAAGATISADSVGPSIMVGEGGWVQGWAGDPLGAHFGRQVTIYRPSLTLSDYRVEFQGQIETKSIGWVFRATDPNNYYAMKLAFVSSALPRKIELIKSMVLKGRETELGRIPLNLPASSETVFAVRVDIRGARFNTFVQGQPVDMWMNDQLKSGGVGFLNERAERGRVKSVSISYLTGGEK